jgi:hypothetical protein
LVFKEVRRYTMKRFKEFLYYAMCFGIILTLIVMYSTQQIKASDSYPGKDTYGHTIEEEVAIPNDAHELDSCG